MSLIIVEGPDGAGKSTLIEQLGKERIITKVHHHGAYLGEESILGHYLESINDALISPNGDVVMDRSWIAEPIYGAVMRGGSCRITSEQRQMLERFAVFQCRAVAVLCLPPLEVCLTSWQKRLAREYPQKLEQMQNIYAGYEQWWSSLEAEDNLLPVVRYDYTRPPYAVLNDFIANKVRFT